MQIVAEEAVDQRRLCLVIVPEGRCSLSRQEQSVTSFLVVPG